MKEKNYPLYEVQPFNSIKEMIELAVRDAGGAVAYKFKDGDGQREITFSEVADTISALGAYLHSKGLSDRHIACTA